MSIKTSIRNSMFLLVAVIVITVGAAHEFLRCRDARQSCQVGANLMTQALAQRFESKTFESPKELTRICQKILEIPSVLAVSIQDRSGRLHAHAEINEELAERLFAESKVDLASLDMNDLQMSDGLVEDDESLVRIFTPLAGDTDKGAPTQLGLVLQLKPKVAASAAHFWFFYLPAGAVGMIGFVLGWWRVRRDVVRPICELSQTIHEGQPPTQNMGNKPLCHELGVITRAFSGLWKDLHAERNRNQVIERRVEKQIAEETRRISRDLRRMQKVIWSDSLTGVLNRRFLEEKYPLIFNTQLEAGQDLSLVMLDLDHFKNLNDKQGHEAGDDILRFVGELLKQCLRSDDFAVRYGGDEFVLILPSVSAKAALSITNRILVLFTQRAKMMVKVQPVPSMTAGIASLHNNQAANPDELMALADEGLLAAKQTGKRKAVISASMGVDLKRPSSKNTSRSDSSTTIVA